MKGDKVMVKFQSGVIPSGYSAKDYLYSSVRETMTSFASRGPAINKNIPVRNQGAFPSCVGFATARMRDEQEFDNYGVRIDTSASFAYLMGKLRDRQPAGTPGTQPRAVLEGMRTVGICLENTMPYTAWKSGDLPAMQPGSLEEAGTYKISNYARILRHDEIKSAILTGGSVMLAVLVCENFLTAPGGVIPLPEGKILGFHAITALTWDDEKSSGANRGYYPFVNSWGPEWGAEGYGYIPYRSFDPVPEDQIPPVVEAWSSLDIIIPPETARSGSLWIGQKRALLDGQEVILDVAPSLDPGGRAMVPVRFLIERAGYRVKWNAAERRIDFER